jgi:hypothetical protein
MEDPPHRWRGGEATGDGADRLGGGAGRQWRAKQTEKKNGEKGSVVGGRWLLKALGAWGGEGKGGVRLGAAWGQEERRGGGGGVRRRGPARHGRGGSGLLQ